MIIWSAKTVKRSAVGPAEVRKSGVRLDAAATAITMTKRTNAKYVVAKTILRLACEFAPLPDQVVIAPVSIIIEATKSPMLPIVTDWFGERAGGTIGSNAKEEIVKASPLTRRELPSKRTLTDP